MNSVPMSVPACKAWRLPSGTLFFMFGILLGRIAESGFPALIALALCLAACLLAGGIRRWAAALLAVLSAGVVIGWYGYHPALPAEGDCLVRGTVTQEVHLREDGQVQTLLSDVTLDGVRQGDAYWTWYLDEEESLPVWLVPGVQLTMTAEVYHPAGRSNPGGFDFREYLLQRDVTYGLYGAEALVQQPDGFSLTGWMAGLRHRLAWALHDAMGEEAGALASAMLLGVNDFIPEDERAAFADLGIAHILSISGFHVAVLAGLLALLMRPLPLSQKGQFLLEIGLLIAYCLLTGEKAPVVRAAMLLFWRRYVHMQHRQRLSLHLLCATALVQLLSNPTQLTGPSFQLTYGAMLGITLVCPWLQARCSFRCRAVQGLWEAFCVTLSAQIGVLAPQLTWFGQLPLLSLGLNLVVIPLVSGLIVLCWLTLLLLPVPGMSGVLGGISAAVTELFLSAVRGIASLEGTFLWTRQADVFTLIGCLLLLTGLSARLPCRWVRHRGRMILAGTLLTAMILLPLPQTTTTYTQLSVGDADAAILQDCDMTVVIDSGEDGQALAQYLHRQRQGVELLILTHLHADHAGGLRALLDEDIPVDVCCLPDRAEAPLIDEETLPLLTELAAAGTEFRYLRRGDVIPLPSGALTVLWPMQNHANALHDANDVCLVLQAEIGGVTMLLSADLTGVYAQYVQQPADVLKAAHHGSRNANTADILAAVSPQAVLLSNSAESRERHMTALTGDTPLYTTERHGAISIHFDGDGAFRIAPFCEGD